MEEHFGMSQWKSTIPSQCGSLHNFIHAYANYQVGFFCLTVQLGNYYLFPRTTLPSTT